MKNKKTIINIISSLTLQIVAIICGFIVPKLIISTYGSNVNGLVTSITQFLAYITLLESGFGPVIKSILYKPIANQDEKEIAKILKTSEKIFRIISYIFIGYIILLCIILPFILQKEFDRMLTLSLIIIISISTFAEYYFGMTYRLYLQAKQEKYIVSIIQISTLAINTIVVWMLIKLKTSIQIVKLASALIFVLRPVLQNIYVKKKYNINLKKVVGNYQIKQKWDGLAQHMAYVIHKNTDIVILTLCGNLAEVSVYAVYLMIINSIKNIVISFSGGIDAKIGDIIAKKEQEKLNKCFNIYEGYYLTIASIVFCSTFFLLVPFIKLYTYKITDTNYIRPIFAYLIILAEFIFIIRQPYNDLVKVAGHFKETRNGAWVEAISNIIISFIMVWHFGIIGVAIGTLFAMLIRTTELIYYTSRYILQRNVWYSFKRILIIILELLIIAFIIRMLPHVEINEYKVWIMQAMIVSSISSVVIISINSLIYKGSFKKFSNFC